MTITQFAKFYFIKLIALTFSLYVFPQSVFAAELDAPDEIIYSGEIYKLAFQNIIPNSQALYEYTMNEESI